MLYETTFGEAFLYGWWNAMGRDINSKRIEETIVVDYEDDEVLEVVFEYRAFRDYRTKSLKAMRDILGERFENVEIDDDYVIVYLTKEELVENLDFIKKYFIRFEIENDNREFYIG